MNPIEYIDRLSGRLCKEEVYGGNHLEFLYGTTWLSRFCSPFLLRCIARNPLFSKLYGYVQKLPASRSKIAPFIQTFGVDATEFEKKPSEFVSFNDFFTRTLKPQARPIAASAAVIPADGRYLFYQNISEADGFVVKGKKFDLDELLQDRELADLYREGSLVLARLCPSDYHRYHFPCDAVPEPSRAISGHLYSVNPIALKNRIEIFTENKRRLIVLNTTAFGKVTVVEVGATCVGAIHETYTPSRSYRKGDEMGYFSFGGSSLVLLFPPRTILFDRDLQEASRSHTEIRCLMGQSLGN